MVKNFLLTTLAVILFVFAVFIDGYLFEESVNDIWTRIDVVRFVSIFSIVAAAGFILALFLFRHKKYNQRLSRTIPISFILFSFAAIAGTVVRYYGLDEEHNYFTAKRDIRDGKIQIMVAGLLVPDPAVDFERQEAARKLVQQRFGYKTVYVGCIVSNGLAIYNNVMGDFLNKKNGPDWTLKEEQMLDSIYSVYSLPVADNPH